MLEDPHPTACDPQGIFLFVFVSSWLFAGTSAIHLLNTPTTGSPPRPCHCLRVRAHRVFLGGKVNYFSSTNVSSGDTLSGLLHLSKKELGQGCAEQGGNMAIQPPSLGAPPTATRKKGAVDTQRVPGALAG